MYSKQCAIKVAEASDIDELSKMLYKTEINPEYEWGIGTYKEHIKKIRRLMLQDGNRFSYKNFKVLKKGDEIIGFCLAMEGSKIKFKTLKSDIKLYKMEQGFKRKFRFFIQVVLYIFDLECLFNEYYLSNIYIKKEYRGLGYSHILLEDVLNQAIEKRYKKISLRANNTKLMEFYSNWGYKRRGKYSKKMVLKL